MSEIENYLVVYNMEQHFVTLCVQPLAAVMNTYVGAECIDATRFARWACPAPGNQGNIEANKMSFSSNGDGIR